jgi:hypothetical protein
MDGRERLKPVPYWGDVRLFKELHAWYPPPVWKDAASAGIGRQLVREGKMVSGGVAGTRPSFFFVRELIMLDPKPRWISAITNWRETHAFPSPLKMTGAGNSPNTNRPVDVA